MTNYFGKSRLIKLFYCYISDRTEYINSLKADIKEFGKEYIFDYSKYRGNEWLEVQHEGYAFKIYAFGSGSKVVTLDEDMLDYETSDDLEKIKVNRIVSYYSPDFYPFPHNKDKALDCYTIAKEASKAAETAIIYQSEDKKKYDLHKIRNDGSRDITARCTEIKIALPDGFTVYENAYLLKTIRNKKTKYTYEIRQNCNGEPFLYGGIKNHSAKITVLEERNCDDDVIFVDTETTGLIAGQDEVLQISVINNGGKILLDSYIRPENHTEWKEAERVNNISPELVADAPLLSEIAPKLCDIISRAKVVIGYNIEFDWGFILKMLENTNYDFLNNAKYLKCCMKKFAEVYGDWNEEYQSYRWQKLSTAANYYNIKWQGNAHGSLADTLMCRDVWHKMNKQDKIRCEIYNESE